MTTPQEWARANADPVIMVCAVCGRVLDKHTLGATGGYEWIHPFDVRRDGEDHQPWPVPDSQIGIEDKCDFCFESNPQWILPAKTFGVAMLNALPNLPDEHFSSGDWACCDGCAELLNRGDWRGVRRRAVEGYQSRHEGEPTPLIDVMLTSLYTQLRKAVTGPVRHK